MYLFDGVIDAFTATLSTLRGAENELINPYDLSQGIESNKEDAWGILVGGASPSTTPEFKNIGYTLTVSTILTKSIIRTDFDQTCLTAALKTLFQAETDIRNRLLQPDLNQLTTADIFFDSINPPEFFGNDLITDEPSYLALISNYSVRIPEPLR